MGRGFKFNTDEEDKIKAFRMELSKEYGFTVDKDEELDLDGDKSREGQEKAQQAKLLKLLDRDEHARKLALERGNKAANQALLDGLSPTSVKTVTMQEIMRALTEYKPMNVTVERGVGEASRIRDMFIQEENQREGIFTYELEINDL